MSQTENRIMDSETNVNIEKIDVAFFMSDLFRAFRGMWLYVIILAVLCSAITGIHDSKNYIPYYTASATFTVNIHEEQYYGAGTNTSFYNNDAAEQMAITFPKILTSGVLQRKVAKELNIPAVSGVIRAEAVNGTNLFTLSVRDSEPERAYATLQAVIDHYPEISEVIVGKLNMKLFDETGVPTTPDNSKNVKRSVVKGAIVGMTLGFGWVVIVALSRRTIRREEDCPKLVNQKCLGGLPLVYFKERSRKAKRCINILTNEVGGDYLEAIRIIRNKVERSARENNLKVILVTSALPGEGKSTLAVNLAISLAQEGKRVALLDCDIRNPSDSEILDIEVEVGLVDFLSKRANLGDCLHKISLTGVFEKAELLFMPGGKGVSDGASILGDDLMRQVVTYLKNKVDYVILDSAPVGLLTDASVLSQYADGAIFVVKKDFARVDYIMNGMIHLAEGDVYMLGCVLNGE